MKALNIACVSALAIIAATPISSAALAQEAAAQSASDNTGITDIVVTAQRRSENLQSVPIAVTAYTPEALARKGLRDTRDLAMTTPSLTIGSQFGSTSSPPSTSVARSRTTP